MNIQERMILYALGKLSEAESQQLTQELKHNTELKLEFEAIQKVLEQVSLHDYLEGTLSTQEVQALEQRLKEDPALAKALETYEKLYYVTDQVVLSDLDLSLDKNLHEDIQAIRKKSASRSKRPLSRIQRSFRIAATILFLVMAGVFFVLLRNTYNNETIALRAFETHSASDFLKGDNSVPQGNFLRGLYELDGEQYEAAIEYLSKVPSSDSTYANAQFFLGNAYLGSRAYEGAITAFNTSYNTASNPCTLQDCTTKTQWYTALAHLAHNQEELAKGILISLEKNAGDKYYRDKATQVLKELDSFWR